MSALEELKAKNIEETTAIEDCILQVAKDKSQAFQETARKAAAELTMIIEEWNTLSKRISDLLTSDHQAVDEFNAGFDAYNAGLDIDDSESFYRHTHEDIPSYDTFSTGYAWAKFNKERNTVEKE